MARIYIDYNRTIHYEQSNDVNNFFLSLYSVNISYAGPQLTNEYDNPRLGSMCYVIILTCTIIK